MQNNCDVTPRPKSVREFFGSWYFWKPFIGVVAGGLLGFLYYYFVGCNSGTCAITSKPLNSIIFGAIMGFLITGSPCARSRK